jgi:hypothetical protein
MTQSKKAFGGQWVDIFRTGVHTDDKGRKHTITHDFLAQVVANFNTQEHEPPAVIGHPQTDAPAFGWVDAQRVEGDVLQVQFGQVDPAFEQMVSEGKFKKRSASFYLDAQTAPGGRAPSLRHVGFLGAQPPAVKGLREIHFNEGETLTFESITFSEGESMDEKEMKKTIAESVKEFFSEMFGKKDGGTQAAFSEADINKHVKDAVAAVEAKFSEQFKTLETANEELQRKVEQQTGLTTRGEIVSFCESLGKSKFPPAFYKMGVVEFMESLAATPDRKVTVVTFSEEGGQKKEIKTESTQYKWFKDFLSGIGPVIQFGEQFSNLHSEGDGKELADPTEMERLRAGAGVKKTEGGAK